MLHILRIIFYTTYTIFTIQFGSHVFNFECGNVKQNLAAACITSAQFLQGWNLGHFLGLNDLIIGLPTHVYCFSIGIASHPLPAEIALCVRTHVTLFALAFFLLEPPELKLLSRQAKSIASARVHTRRHGSMDSCQCVLRNERLCCFAGGPKMLQ